MTSTNALGIPEQTFGISGIRTGNAIAEAFAKKDKRLIASYDSDSRKITILHSEALPYSTLTTILSEVVSNNALNYLPHIEESKGRDGNWQISLIYCERVSSFSMRSSETKTLELRPAESETVSFTYQSVSNDGRNWPVTRVLPKAKH